MSSSSCISLGAISFEASNQIVICPSNKELSRLNDQYRSRRGSHKRFIRQCINRDAIEEAPPVDMPTLVYEVRSSRNILNQLLRTVSSIGPLDEAKLRRVLGHNREMEGCIVEAYPKG